MPQKLEKQEHSQVCSGTWELQDQLHNARLLSAHHPHCTDVARNYHSWAQLLPCSGCPGLGELQSGLWSCCTGAELSRVLSRATQALASSSNPSVLREMSSSPARN